MKRHRPLLAAALAALLGALSACSSGNASDGALSEHKDAAGLLASTPAPSEVNGSATSEAKAKAQKAAADAAAARAAADAKAAADAAATQAAAAQAASAAGSAYFANCDAARAAGVAPVRSGDPAYSRKLDRDGDGVGCED